MKGGNEETVDGGLDTFSKKEMRYGDNLLADLKV
jgi:hypothetical protein